MTDVVPAHNGLYLPRWFLTVCGFAWTALVVPAVWFGVSLKSDLGNLKEAVVVLKVRVEGTQELKERLDRLVEKLDQRHALLQKGFDEHKGDPRIHHTGIEVLHRRLDQLESRLEALEGH